MKGYFHPVYAVLVLLFAFPLHAEQAPDGTAAIVNGHPISMAEVDRQSKSEEALLRSQYSGDDLQAKTREVRQRKLNVLIDRELIIESFYKSDFKVPDSEINSRVNSIIKSEYGGDRVSFEQTLQERGVTLAIYRQEIAVNLIIPYMRAMNINDKIPETLTHPSERIAEGNRLRDAWFASLRKDAEITIYQP